MKKITLAIFFVLLGVMAAQSQPLPLIRTLKNNKWGFEDRAGKPVVEPKYERANDFREGLALVSKDGKKYGYIDSTGAEVIPLKYDHASDFNEGVAAVELSGKGGIIDKTDKVVVELKYESVGGFREGLCYVMLNKKYGFIDHSGAEVIPIKYDDSYSFHEGLAYAKLNDKYGFIDKTGKVVIDMEYDKVDDFSEGLARVRKGGYFTGKWGYVDKTGKLAIPLTYEKAQNFYRGRAEVEDRGKFYIDYWGNPVGSDYRAKEIGYTPNTAPPGKSNAGTTTATHTGYNTDFIDSAKKKMARMIAENRKSAAPKISVVGMADYVLKKDIKGLLEFTKKAGVTGYTEKRSFGEGRGKVKKDSVTTYTSSETIKISEGFYERLKIHHYKKGNIEIEYPFQWFDMDAVKKEITDAGYSIEINNSYSNKSKILRINMPENASYPYVVIFRND